MIIEDKEVNKTTNYILVECDVKLSKKCKNIYKTRKNSAMRVINKNQKIICRNCSSIHAKLHDYPIFKNTEDLSPHECYLLGWIISDGHLSRQTNLISLSVKREDSYILKAINKSFNEIFYFREEDGRGDSYIRLHDLIIKERIKNIIGLEKNELKTFHVKIPNTPYQHLLIRGIFEGDGYISKGKNWGLEIATSSPYVEKYFKENHGFITKKENYQIRINKEKGIKFLQYIYDGSFPELILHRKYKKYLQKQF